MLQRPRWSNPSLRFREKALIAELAPKTRYNQELARSRPPPALRRQASPGEEVRMLYGHTRFFKRSQEFSTWDSILETPLGAIQRDHGYDPATFVHGLPQQELLRSVASLVCSATQMTKASCARNTCKHAEIDTYCHLKRLP